MTTTVTDHDRTRSLTEVRRVRGDEPSAGAAANAPQRIPLPRRLLGGALAGLVAGIGMYATLAVFAVGEHLGPGYPLRAVHALMSGARVLPDYPGQSLYGPQTLDVLMAPLFFFGPALAVGIFTAVRLGRAQSRRPGRPTWRLAATPAITASLILFLSMVAVAWLRDATPAVQRFSTGYGIRELGLGAWLVAHVVFVMLLATLIGPLTRVVVLTIGWRDRSRGDDRDEVFGPVGSQ